MRPVDAVALLNSTPLGAVIGERQLHRHRSRAGDDVRVGRRVNFLAYVAWLCRQRHTPSPRIDQAVSYKDILELLKAQDYRCALSGWPLTPETAALDHVLAISRGGPHARSNLQVLHRDVNRAKHTLTNEEFVRLCHAVVEHTALGATGATRARRLVGRYEVAAPRRPVAKRRGRVAARVAVVPPGTKTRRSERC